MVAVRTLSFSIFLRSDELSRPCAAFPAPWRGGFFCLSPLRVPAAAGLPGPEPYACPSSSSACVVFSERATAGCHRGRGAAAGLQSCSSTAGAASGRGRVWNRMGARAVCRVSSSEAPPMGGPSPAAASSEAQYPPASLLSTLGHTSKNEPHRRCCSARTDEYAAACETDARCSSGSASLWLHTHNTQGTQARRHCSCAISRRCGAHIDVSERHCDAVACGRDPVAGLPDGVPPVVIGRSERTTRSTHALISSRLAPISSSFFCSAGLMPTRRERRADAVRDDPDPRARAAPRRAKVSPPPGAAIADIINPETPLPDETRHTSDASATPTNDCAASAK